MIGYLDPAYARSFEAWGRPLLLPRSGGSVLVRRIPGVDALDATGPYPFFVCRDWGGVAEDVAGLSRDIVALVLVTDPFGNFDKSLLHRTFPDLCTPYKDHFVVDLSAGTTAISKNHQRNIQRALRTVEIEVSHQPLALLNTWCRLYDRLIERHGIKGPQRFSRRIFAAQLMVPGMVVFVARQGDEPVGMTLWYEQGEVAYYHLGAYSEKGYALRASFAIFAAAIRHFRRLQWLSIGAGAGAIAQENGLTRFKRGWATGTRQTYLCGAILDADRYRRLTTTTHTSYFPAYRAGEFAEGAINSAGRDTRANSA